MVLLRCKRHNLRSAMRCQNNYQGRQTQGGAMDATVLNTTQCSKITRRYLQLIQAESRSCCWENIDIQTYSRISATEPLVPQ